jgi:hypothetical protein
MDKFRVRIPITLDLEVEADDAKAATDSITEAFARDALKALDRCLGQILDIIVVGPAFEVEDD